MLPIWLQAAVCITSQAPRWGVGEEVGGSQLPNDVNCD